MTVSELIKQLQAVDQGLPVCVFDRDSELGIVDEAYVTDLGYLHLATGKRECMVIR